MADTLLHVTGATALIDKNLLDAPLAGLLRRFRQEYLLGSVAHDLPYYENILVSGVETLLHKPVTYSNWGQLNHQTRSRAMCMRALKNAPSERELAIAIGLLCHFSFDIIFHKEIERWVKEGRTATHEKLENEMGLHCHFDLVGHSGVGRTYCADTLLLSPAAGWDFFINGLIQETYGTSPGAPYLCKCLRSLRLFGFLNSVPFVPWVTTLPADDPLLATLSLRLLDEAMTAAARYMNTAYNCFVERNGWDELLEILPAVSMHDGLREAP